MNKLNEMNAATAAEGSNIGDIQPSNPEHSKKNMNGKDSITRADCLETPPSLVAKGGQRKILEDKELEEVLEQEEQEYEENERRNQEECKQS